jgi:hypothetical protein
MKLQELLAHFSAQSEMGKLIAELMEDDFEIREAAFKRFEGFGSKKLSEKVAVGTLLAATSLAFPPLRFDWNDSAQELLTI